MVIRFDSNQSYSFPTTTTSVASTTGSSEVTTSSGATRASGSSGSSGAVASSGATRASGSSGSSGATGYVRTSNEPTPTVAPKTSSMYTAVAPNTAKPTQTNPRTGRVIDNIKYDKMTRDDEGNAIYWKGDEAYKDPNCMIPCTGEVPASPTESSNVGGPSYATGETGASDASGVSDASSASENSFYNDLSRYQKLKNDLRDLEQVYRALVYYKRNNGEAYKFEVIHEKYMNQLNEQIELTNKYNTLYKECQELWDENFAHHRNNNPETHNLYNSKRAELDNIERQLQKFDTPEFRELKSTYEELAYFHRDHKKIKAEMKSIEDKYPDYNFGGYGPI